MTTPMKGQDKPTPESKKRTTMKAEIDRGKPELSNDELKKVTGGKMPTAVE